MRLALHNHNEAYSRCYRISYVGLGGVLIWAIYLVDQRQAVDSGSAA